MPLSEMWEDDSSFSPEKHAGFYFKGQNLWWFCSFSSGHFPCSAPPSIPGNSVFLGWVFVTQFSPFLFLPEYDS